IEARRLAVLEGEIVAAAGTDEDLGPAILVEEEDRGLGIELLDLAEQEIDQRGLARSRLADDHRVRDGLLAQRILRRMGGVEIEVVRLPVGGLQGGHALAPWIVVALPGREAVERRK